MDGSIRVCPNPSQQEDLEQPHNDTHKRTTSRTGGAARPQEEGAGPPRAREGGGRCVGTQGDTSHHDEERTRGKQKGGDDEAAATRRRGAAHIYGRRRAGSGCTWSVAGPWGWATKKKEKEICVCVGGWCVRGCDDEGEGGRLSGWVELASTLPSHSTFQHIIHSTRRMNGVWPPRPSQSIIDPQALIWFSQRANEQTQAKNAFVYAPVPTTSPRARPRTPQRCAATACSIITVTEEFRRCSFPLPCARESRCVFSFPNSHSFVPFHFSPRSFGLAAFYNSTSLPPPSLPPSYMDQGVAKLAPGVLFVDEVDMPDIKCFT